MENNSQRRENTSRLGYLAAAVLGVAAGLLAKSIYDDIQETVKYEDECSEAVINEESNSPAYMTRPHNLPGRTEPEDFIATNDELCCPITRELMREPVFSKNCGHTFDRKSIEGWLIQSKHCPLCKKPMTKNDLIPNYNLKNLIQKLA